MKNSQTKVAFLTLGCKVNSYETVGMENIFKKAGYTLTKFDNVADIYVVNTCSVTNIADRKSRQMLHKAKKNNPNAIVVATGCYAQTSKEEAIKDESIDIVIGNNQKNNIVEIVEKYILDNTKNDAVEDISKENVFENMNIEDADEKTRAYIKIQDGCNQFCSYCIIPYARGRIRSRKLDDIITEVHRLAEAGYKEIIITGIHVSSYGMDITKSKEFDYIHLYKVIEAISEVEKIERIRLSSLEPRIITDEFIDKLSKNNKVCPHFHLSLQSGCDEILKKMNRKYSTEEFLEKCDIIRKYYDKPAITTDVIVGFPGETDENFEDTVKFLEKVNFSQMHVFKYSARKGTVAAKMPNQIKMEVKNNRSQVLLDMTKEQHKDYLASFIGSSQRILFEESIVIDGKEYMIGHNERYVKIVAESKENLSNLIKEVQIIGMLTDDTLEGIII